MENPQKGTTKEPAQGSPSFGSACHTCLVTRRPACR